jgi:hypothetical protein
MSKSAMAKQSTSESTEGFPKFFVIPCVQHLSIHLFLAPESRYRLPFKSFYSEKKKKKKGAIRNVSHGGKRRSLWEGELPSVQCRGTLINRRFASE